MYKAHQVARRCGAKHISKSKCAKHTRFGALLEVEMLEKCTPLWPEAHFEVKSIQKCKKWQMPFVAQQHPGGPWRCQSLNGGSLAELLRFWCCQVQKWGKSRGIASFSNLRIDRFNGWMDGWNYNYHYNYTTLQCHDNCKYTCKYTTLQCTNYTTLR